MLLTRVFCDILSAVVVEETTRVIATEQRKVICKIEVVENFISFTCSCQNFEMNSDHSINKYTSFAYSMVVLWHVTLGRVSIGKVLTDSLSRKCLFFGFCRIKTLETKQEQNKRQDTNCRTWYKQEDADDVYRSGCRNVSQCHLRQSLLRTTLTRMILI